MKIKNILLALLTLLFSVIIYLFIPLNLEIRYGLEDEIPHKIIVTKAGFNSNGMPLTDSIQIEDKDEIINIYKSLKEIKLSKSFRSSKHTNWYVVNIVNHADKTNLIKTISLTDDLVHIQGLDYKIIDSQKSIEEIIDILEKIYMQRSDG